MSLEASDLLFVDHLNTRQQGFIQGPLTVGHQVGCLPGGRGFPGHKHPRGGRETVKECVSCLGCTFQSLMIKAPTSTGHITWKHYEGPLPYWPQSSGKVERINGKKIQVELSVNYRATETEEDALMFFVLPDLERPFLLLGYLWRTTIWYNTLLLAQMRHQL